MPVPLESPKRNLIFHCYAVKKNEALWRWHVAEIKRRLDIFTGRRIVAIASDSKTSPESEVREAFGEGFEFRHFRNVETKGEGVTFLKLLAEVESLDPDESTFYAHSKGVSYLPGKQKLGKKPWHSPDVIRHWCEQLYRANLDRMDLVDDALINHGACGSFRRHQRLVSGDWYYSGAFFWFRHIHTFSRDWKKPSIGRLAAEAWPGSVFAMNQAACLCGEGVGSLYLPGSWPSLDSQVDELLQRPNPEPRKPPVVIPPDCEISILTATGDRPDAFRLCEEWMRRQTYSKPYQWIVVDDGMVPTKPTMGQEYIRRTPERGHTLTRQLRAALPKIRGEKILFIEDDEWYHPDYLSRMAAWLNDSEKVGAGFARYYWPRLARYREFPDHAHASLCRTGIRRSLLPQLAAACQGVHPSVDMRLWESGGGERHDGDVLVVGMKGMPGRASGGGDSASGKPDPCLGMLTQWIGGDKLHYERFLPKPILPRELTVFTVVLDGYDKIRPPKYHRDNVRYVAITDGKANGWEVIRPPKRQAKSIHHETRRLKILGPELFFPDADLTLYIDGQLQMTCDPWAWLAECEAWGPADLYLFRHHERDCVYDESEAVIRVRKDNRKTVAPQIQKYRTAGFPAHAGLYLGGILTRTKAATEFSRAWWNEVSRGSHRDQLSLPVALAQSGIRFAALPGLWWENFLLRHNHEKQRRPARR